jgi:type II secretion system protein I
MQTRDINTHKEHKSNRGFTLLETLVALAILAMGVVGVLGAFSSSMRATKEAELYSQASNLAAQVAAQLDREETVSAGELSGTFEDTPAFSWVATVEEADSNNLMRTTITVTWGTDTNPKNFDMVICLHPQGESTAQDATTNSSSRTTGGG